VRQSGRRRLPHLHPAQALADWLPTVAGTALLLDPRAERSLAALPAPHGEATLLVDRGGLSVDERERAARGGFVAVRLGPRILRTETAPLAALTAMQCCGAICVRASPPACSSYDSADRGEGRYRVVPPSRRRPASAE